jgi:hypothetical protein
VDRQTHKVRVGYLLMPDDPGLAASNSVEQPNLIRPELMPRVCEVRS